MAVAAAQPRDILARLGIKTLAGREAALGYAIVGVVYLFFLCFVFGPILLAFSLSFTFWDGLRELDSVQFVGIGNYTRLLSDQRFLLSIQHDLEFAAKSYVGQIACGMLLALAANNIARGRTLFRWITFMPVVLPIPATAMLFVILMNPVFGTFNAITSALGLGTSSWLSQPETAMNSATLMVIWKFAGYYMILFLAAFATVPQELYDAAHVDGANRWQTFSKITWPLIRPAFMFISIINVIGNLQVFTPIWMMTAGGPLRATEVVVVLMYNTAFTYFQYSLANAMAIILFLLILILTALQMQIMRKGGMEAL
jgi:ABC-type sugar transport system permease subunit